MAKDPYSAYRQAIIQRTRELRDARRFTQEEVAEALGISTDAYRKYEKRTVIPAQLLEGFAVLVKSNIEYIITGKGKRRKPALR